MIRLRGKDGKSGTVNSNVRYIELCDEEDNLISLIRTDNGNTIELFSPGDLVFENYITAYHKKQAVILYCEPKKKN